MSYIRMSPLFFYGNARSYEAAFKFYCRLYRNFNNLRATCKNTLWIIWIYLEVTVVNVSLYSCQSVVSRLISLLESLCRNCKSPAYWTRRQIWAMVGRSFTGRRSPYPGKRARYPGLRVSFHSGEAPFDSEIAARFPSNVAGPRAALVCWSGEQAKHVRSPRRLHSEPSVSRLKCFT